MIFVNYERSCSWCHEMNGTDVRYCANCGHEAHKARLACQCPRCQGVATVPDLPAVDVTLCSMCGEQLATLTDRRKRGYCQTCADSQTFCPSCDLEYPRVLVGTVIACVRCAHKIKPPRIVVCEFCGDDVADGAGCQRCNPIEPSPYDGTYSED